MSPKPRKLRIDSTENATRIFAHVNTSLNPPGHVPLGDSDWPFWRNIVSEFATADWTEHQLEIAALLARTMAELTSQQELLRAEGMVIARPNGNALNPRNRVVNTLTSQTLAYRRTLCLSVRAKAGRSDDAARQREANRRIERDARTSGDDDLLA